MPTLIARAYARLLLAAVLLLIGLPALAIAASIADEAHALITGDPGQRAAVLLAAGVAGMAAHYVKKRIRGEIAGSLLDYIFRDHPQQTAMAAGAVFSAWGSAVLSGQAAAMPLGQLVLTGVLAGWTCDSALNQGAAP